ncbi:hypothetical protein [Ralstonia solanacearum]|uniref:hypothetical protein n=1 Tax=Ralstonia solanacearum TaxID=305 RepID=UPI000E66DAAC|nr:hypothetical protein RSP822_15115 [Ralstonia solanacearum]
MNQNLNRLLAQSGGSSYTYGADPCYGMRPGEAATYVELRCLDIQKRAAGLTLSEECIVAVCSELGRCMAGGE